MLINNCWPHVTVGYVAILFAARELTAPSISSEADGSFEEGEATGEDSSKADSK